MTHSPSGGGTNQAAKTTNPAWDCVIVPKYEVAQEYRYQARVVLRPSCPLKFSLNMKSGPVSGGGSWGIQNRAGA